MSVVRDPLLLTEQELNEMRFTLSKLNELRAAGLLTSTLEPHRERLEALMQEAPLLREELSAQLRALERQRNVRSEPQIVFATEPDPADREQMAIVLLAGLRDSELRSVTSPDGFDVKPVWSGNAMNYVPRWLAEALRPRLAPAVNERRLLVCKASDTLFLAALLRKPFEEDLRRTRQDIVEIYPNDFEKIVAGQVSETLAWIVERTTSIALLTAWFLRADPKDGLYRKVQDELGELARKRLLDSMVRALSPEAVRTAKALFAKFEASVSSPIDRLRAAGEATSRQLQERRDQQNRRST